MLLFKALIISLSEKRRADVEILLPSFFLIFSPPGPYFKKQFQIYYMAITCRQKLAAIRFRMASCSSGFKEEAAASSAAVH